MADLTQTDATAFHDAVVVVVSENSRFGALLGDEMADAGAEVAMLNGGESVDAAAVNAAIGDVVARHRRIDSFVYVLNEVGPDSLADMRNAHWDNTRQLSRRMFWYYRAVGKQMAKQRQGSMIGVHFGINACGDAHMLSWAVLGEMLVGMSKCLAVELLKQNVRVNTLAYGYMDDVGYAAFAHDDLEGYRRYFGIQRKGTAKDVAGAVKLLAGGEGCYITGQSIHVNGGLII